MITKRDIISRCSFCEKNIYSGNTILLTKITAAQNEVALSYHRVGGLYFLAVIFALTLIMTGAATIDLPWCYTVNPDKKFEYCSAIEMCLVDLGKSGVSRYCALHTSAHCTQVHTSAHN